jgi:hypothetical protein
VHNDFAEGVEIVEGVWRADRRPLGVVERGASAPGASSRKNFQSILKLKVARGDCGGAYDPLVAAESAG